MQADLKNRSEKAYEYLREQMLTGRLRAGARLSDAVLANEIGVSRTPVREALIRLQSEGFVQQISRIGIFIRIPALQDLLEMYEMRRLLEIHAAGVAARRASPRQLKELKHICDQMCEAISGELRRDDGSVNMDTLQRGVLLDVSFHIAIMKAAGNRSLVRIVSDAQLMAQLCGHNWADTAARSLELRAGDASDGHRRIYDAIASGDPADARQAMREHLLPVHRVKKGLAKMHSQLVSQDVDDWPQALRESIRAVSGNGSRGETL